MRFSMANSPIVQETTKYVTRQPLGMEANIAAPATRKIGENYHDCLKKKHSIRLMFHCDVVKKQKHGSTSWFPDKQCAVI